MLMLDEFSDQVTPIVKRFAWNLRFWISLLEVKINQRFLSSHQENALQKTMIRFASCNDFTE
jgi:hypothetical protein